MAKSAADYQVGWICALPLELAAAEGMLDEIHDSLPHQPHDPNQYTYGRIGPHNIVIACLPAGDLGIAVAAHVANHLHTSFRSLRFALLVGIGGGVPGQDFKIRLGDVVVSQPTGAFGGVVQYTFGKTAQDGLFHRTGYLNGPPQVLLAAVSRLQAKHKREGHEIAKYMEGMFDKYPKMRSSFAFPGRAADSLFQADYDHPRNAQTCAGCDKTKLVARDERADDGVVVHYGNIASGDTVMKHGLTRDAVSKDSEAICFEMEAAGLMKNYPCIVIRGICDYADSHKNKNWQDHAAAVAAAYAKELLYIITPHQVITTNHITTEIGDQGGRHLDRVSSEAVESSTDRPELLVPTPSFDRDNKEKRLSWLSFVDSSRYHNGACQKRTDGTGGWFLEDTFRRWEEGSEFLWLSGKAGCGKTVLSSTIIEELKSRRQGIALYFYFSYERKAETITLLELAKSLLSQLVRTLTKESPPGSARFTMPQPYVELYEKFYPESHPSPQDVVSTLLSSLTESEEIYIIIDALDECSDSKDRLEVINFLVQAVQASPGKIRVLLTSRVDEDIQYGLDLASQSVRVDEIQVRASKISNDVIKHVENILSRTPAARKWPESTRLLVKQYLIDHSQGVFIWVDCQLKLLTAIRRPSDVEKALKELPPDLDKMYERMLEKVDESGYSKEAHTALKWLAFSTRPISIQEAAEASIFGLGDNSDICDNDYPVSFDVGNRFSDHSDIRHILSHLVDVTDQSDSEMKFARYSIREYLLCDRIRKSWRLEKTRDHRFILENCLVYILHCVTQKDETGAIKWDQFTLSDYACNNWAIHAKVVFESGAETPYTVDLLLQLFSSLNCPFSAITERLRLKPDNDPGYLGLASHCPSPAWYLAYHGFQHGLGLFKLHHNLVDCGIQKIYLALTPLGVACRKGYEGVAAALLGMGADSELKGRHGNAPLSLAVSLGHELVVQALLENGAEPHSIFLHHALFRGYDNILLLLLQYRPRDDFILEIRDCDASPDDFSEANKAGTRQPRGPRAADYTIINRFSTSTASQITHDIPSERNYDATSLQVCSLSVCDDEYPIQCFESLGPFMAALLRPEFGGVNIKTYMSIYTDVHHFSHTVDVTTFGLSQTSAHGQMVLSSGIASLARDLVKFVFYEKLSRLLDKHVADVAASMIGKEGSVLLTVYERAWSRYIFAAKYANHVLSYMNCNYVIREMDKGVKGIFYVQDLFLWRWKIGFGIADCGMRIPCALKSAQKTMLLDAIQKSSSPPLLYSVAPESWDAESPDPSNQRKKLEAQFLGVTERLLAFKTPKPVRHKVLAELLDEVQTFARLHLSPSMAESYISIWQRELSR